MFIQWLAEQSKCLPRPSLQPPLTLPTCHLSRAMSEVHRNRLLRMRCSSPNKGEEEIYGVLVNDFEADRRQTCRQSPKVFDISNGNITATLQVKDEQLHAYSDQHSAMLNSPSFHIIMSYSLASSIRRSRRLVFWSTSLECELFISPLLSWRLSSLWFSSPCCIIQWNSFQSLWTTFD